MFALDTNILIYYAAGDKKVSKFVLEKIEHGIPLILPTIVVTEFFSFPGLKTKEITLFSRLFQKLQIIPLDFEIAKRAAFLRQKYNIKLGDSIIAATSLFTYATLITRNIKDFQKIPHLKLLKI